jgi:PAS domain S-box-containing protein
MTVLQFPNGGRDRRAVPAARSALSPPMPAVMPMMGRRLTPQQRQEEFRLLKQAALCNYYRQLIDAAGDAIIGLSAEGTVRLWSRGAEALFGYHEDEVRNRGIGFLAAFPPSGQSGQGDPAAWWNGRKCRWDSMKRCSDGSLLKVSIRSTPVEDFHGRHIGTVWMINALPATQ